MDAPTQAFLIRWMMVFAAASVFLVWGLVLMYLDKRDRQRKQDHPRSG